MKNIQFALLLLVLFTGCSAVPGLRKWEGKKFTLCCDSVCNKEDWDLKLSEVCSGGRKQIGGEFSEKVSGYKLEKQKVGDKEEQTVKQEVAREECRTYECDKELSL